MAGPVTNCRACGGRLAVTMADLGVQPPSNAFLASLEAAREEKRYPLRAKVCEACKLVQVDYDVAPEELFGDYVYFSSYSEDWLAHARSYCEMACRRFGLGRRSLVVELASNDGYLLRNFVEMGIPVLGIDPSDTVARAAESVGVPTLVEFFGESVGARLAGEGRGADLIVANNVLAHVPRLNDFVSGIARLLKPGGTATIEFPHLLELIEHVEFDTIYHEHYSYLSIYSIEQVFARHGLSIYDAEELPTHGGSLRIFAAHADRAGLGESGVLAALKAR
jgi:SAM-dependent methyltransferase